MTLPFASEYTTASLERIVIGPGSSSETEFAGPVLLYFEEGILNVDDERHRLTIILTADQKAIHGEKRIRRGNIPVGYGVYSADGQTGPLKNAGESNLKLIAVLFVPQPIYAEEGESFSLTAEPTSATPAP